MGKWLDKDGLIDLKTRIKTKVDTKVDKYTEESAGKFLQTDSNGNAVWGTAASPSAVAEATEQWLDDHVSGGSTIAVDDSLTVEGAAADAKATGALVKSAATQPTDSTNRLWINESSETEYQVPTLAEHNDLKSALDALAEEINVFDPNITIYENAYLDANGNKGSSASTSPIYYVIEKQYLEAGTYIFYAKDAGIGVTRICEYSTGGAIPSHSAGGSSLSGEYVTVNGYNCYKFTLSSAKYVAINGYCGSISALEAYQFGLSKFGIYEGEYYDHGYWQAKETFVMPDVNELKETTMKKSDTLTESLNLIDPANCLTNYTLNGTTGQATSFSGRFVTNYIPVEYGKYYKCTKNDYGAFCGYTRKPTTELDASGAFVSGGVSITAESDGTKISIASSSVKYIRIVFINTNNPLLKCVSENSLFNNIIYSYNQRVINPVLIDPYRIEKNKFTTWYYNKKLVSFGDSITAQSLWQSFVVNAFRFGSHVNCGVGGTTVANDGKQIGGHDSWMSSDYRISTIPEDADVILIFGGHNDWGTVGIGMGNLGMPLSETYFYSAYALMIKKIIARCPNARLFTMTCVGGRTAVENQNQDTQILLPHDVDGVTKDLCMTDFSDAIKAVSEYYGIPCIDVGGESGISVLNHTTYIADVIHPNAAGGKRIANVVINGLKKYEPIDL